MGGRPNYICRCQSVVNNPESPPRPASSHHLPFLLLCVQNISCFLSNRQDVGAMEQLMYRGRRLVVGHISGEGCVSVLHYYPAITSPHSLLLLTILPTEHLQATRAEAPRSSDWCRNLQHFYPQRLKHGSLSFVAWQFAPEIRSLFETIYSL